jgi:hypothetical protein
LVLAFLSTTKSLNAIQIPTSALAQTVEERVYVFLSSSDIVVTEGGNTILVICKYADAIGLSGTLSTDYDGTKDAGVNVGK